MSSQDTKIESMTNQLEKTKLPIGKEELSCALNTLENTSLPTTKQEAWKYTRVAKIGKISFSNHSVQLTDISPFLIEKDTYTLVFVNGHLDSSLSSILEFDGVHVSTLSESNNASAGLLNLEGEIFNSINTAFLVDGVNIEIQDKINLDKTIQIIHILSGQEEISNFKTIIKAGKFSKAKIIQGFFSLDSTNSFCNTVSEIIVEENAHLNIDKLQYEEAGNFHISSEQVDQKKDSTITMNTLTLNGGLTRNNLNIEVNGENCTTNLNGVYILKDKQHVDNHTVVDHKVPNCNSNELYKGVMTENSTAVFNGKVFVREDAQKINAFQSNGNVLLSDNATVNSKPELEIYADDVKCSHGSTTGQLDEEAVFYLRARGLSEKSARKMLVAAFVGDVLEKVENEEVRAFVNEKLLERFGWTF